MKRGQNWEENPNLPHLRPAVPVPVSVVPVPLSFFFFF